MSTYLVCFVVGELETTDAVMAGNVPVRIVHRPGVGHLTRFGLEIGTFALEWFARYYDIPYPAAKLDLIALPDFASGAMENLGAVTFRETLLLADEATASRAELERVADVVAHDTVLLNKAVNPHEPALPRAPRRRAPRAAPRRRPRRPRSRPPRPAPGWVRRPRGGPRAPGR